MGRIYTSRYCQVGLLFFLIGFAGDGLSGVLFLQWADLWLLPLHICAVSVWALGINLLCHQGALPHAFPVKWGILVNKWGVVAFLLGLFTFPGLGMLAYSAALVCATFLRRRMGAVLEDGTSKQRGVSEATILLTIDLSQETDLETKRLAVATLRRQGTPEAMLMLRQLLLDPYAEIRTDASIALTYLEDRLSRSLNDARQQWMKNPSDRGNILDLADQYYQYAQSNVLDKASQQFYLAKAYDLLQCVTAQGATEPDLWLKLAHTCQRLGKLEEALQSVCVVLQLDAHLSDAYVLAMDLAFRLHDWDRLVAFASAGVDALPVATEISETFQWWATLQAK
jgi:hypothetical protein